MRTGGAHSDLKLAVAVRWPLLLQFRSGDGHNDLALAVQVWPLQSSWSLPLGPGEAHHNLELAVEARRCPL